MMVENRPFPLLTAEDASRPEGDRPTTARLNQSSNTESSV